MTLSLRSRSLLSGVLLTFLAPLASDHCSAASVLAYGGTAAVTSRGDGPFTIGSLFQVNTAGLSVTHLGVMDTNSGANGFGASDGLFTSIQVGLWDATGTILLASGTVGSFDTYADGYRYVALSSTVPLTAGQSYLIGAYVGSGIEFFLDGGVDSPQFSSSSPDFTLLENRFAGGGSLAAPTNNGLSTVGRWGAANAMVAAVPEPASACLIGIGILAGGLRRRRRNG